MQSVPTQSLRKPIQITGFWATAALPWTNFNLNAMEGSHFATYSCKHLLRVLHSWNWEQKRSIAKICKKQSRYSHSTISVLPRTRDSNTLFGDNKVNKLDCFIEERLCKCNLTKNRYLHDLEHLQLNGARQARTRFYLFEGSTAARVWKAWMMGLLFFPLQTHYGII